MRLSSFEIKSIKNTFINCFKCGNIYLFGSRVNDSKRGGDIDLYIETPNNNRLFDKKRSIEKEILRTGVLL